MVSGNFFNLVADRFDVIELKVYLIIDEMHYKGYYQLSMYGNVTWFTAGKPVILAEHWTEFAAFQGNLLFQDYRLVSRRPSNTLNRHAGY
jgi:hypothetical protein